MLRIPGLYGDCRSVTCQRVMFPPPSVATWNVQRNEFASVRVTELSLNDSAVMAGVMSVSGRNGGSGLATVIEPVTLPPTA